MTNSCNAAAGPTRHPRQQIHCPALPRGHARACTCSKVTCRRSPAPPPCQLCLAVAALVWNCKTPRAYMLSLTIDCIATQIPRPANISAVSSAAFDDTRETPDESAALRVAEHWPVQGNHQSNPLSHPAERAALDHTSFFRR